MRDDLQELQYLLDQNDQLLKAIKERIKKIVGAKSELEKPDNTESVESVEPKKEEDINSTSGYKIVYVWNYSK